MTTPVIAPRRAWPTVAAAARDLGCQPSQLYPLLVARAGCWHLAPLSERRYRRWRQLVYARHQAGDAEGARKAKS